MNDEKENKMVEAPDPKMVALKLDDVSFALLAFLRTYQRPDTNPRLVRDNCRWLADQLKELQPMLEQIEKSHEGF